jgi:hypothetical protein
MGTLWRQVVKSEHETLRVTYGHRRRAEALVMNDLVNQTSQQVDLMEASQLSQPNKVGNSSYDS